MYNKTITLRPATPNIPLDPVWSARYSAGKMVFTGMPAEMTSAVLVLLLNGSEEAFVLEIDLETDPPSITVENGALAAVGQGNYWVYGFVNTRIFALGKGLLTIDDGPTLAAGGGITPVGNQIPIWSPETQSYFYVTVSVNDDGDASVIATPVP